MTSDAVVLLIAVFGLLLLALACQRLFRARFVAAAGSGLMGALLLAGAALFFVVSLNLHTYNRLTYEQPVAEIVFEARGPQRYRATLAQVPSGELQMFMLAGDEWQLDARVIKWTPRAVQLGAEPLYRVERLSGRYRDLAQAQSTVPSIVAVLWVVAVVGVFNAFAALVRTQWTDPSVMFQAIPFGIVWVLVGLTIGLLGMPSAVADGASTGSEG